MDRFIEWTITNGLKINSDKTIVISFFQKLCLLSSFDYTIASNILSRVFEVKDLGVIFDSELTFNPRITFVSTRASGILGLITRNSSEFRDHTALLQLYRAHVLPILTYASVIWSPHLGYVIYTLESVQRKFLRCLSRHTDSPIKRFDHDFSDISIKSYYKITSCFLCPLHRL